MSRSHRGFTIDHRVLFFRFRGMFMGARSMSSGARGISVVLEVCPVVPGVCPGVHVCLKFYPEVVSRSKDSASREEFTSVLTKGSSVKTHSYPVGKPIFLPGGGMYVRGPS